MEDGGSAVDVAIAAAICNGVVLQNTNGLGGGLSMMIHTHREGGIDIKLMLNKRVHMISLV